MEVIAVHAHNVALGKLLTASRVSPECAGAPPNKKLSSVDSPGLAAEDSRMSETIEGTLSRNIISELLSEVMEES